MHFQYSGDMTTWYHISRDWQFDRGFVTPKIMRIDDEDEPRERLPFIAVCPTVTQCLVALGEISDCIGSPMRVYKTEGDPTPSTWVFDYVVTEEHRFHQGMCFSYIGDIDLSVLVETKGIDLRIQSGMDMDEIINIGRANLAALAYRPIISCKGSSISQSAILDRNV